MLFRGDTPSAYASHGLSLPHHHETTPWLLKQPPIFDSTSVPPLKACQFRHAPFRQILKINFRYNNIVISLSATPRQLFIYALISRLKVMRLHTTSFKNDDLLYRMALWYMTKLRDARWRTTQWPLLMIFSIWLRYSLLAIFRPQYRYRFI